jgi:hypothetical protein
MLLGLGLAAGCGLANPQETLEREVAKLQDQLPMDVGDGMVLNTITAGDMRIEYEYLYTPDLPVGFDKSAFQDEVEKNLLRDVCKQEEMKAFWENGISALFVYKTNDDLHLGRVLITPRSCGYD